MSITKEINEYRFNSEYFLSRSLGIAKKNANLLPGEAGVTTLVYAIDGVSRYLFWFAFNGNHMGIEFNGIDKVRLVSTEGSTPWAPCDSSNLIVFSDSVMALADGLGFAQAGRERMARSLYKFMNCCSLWRELVRMDNEFSLRMMLGGTAGEDSQN